MKKVIIAILVQLLVWVSGSCGAGPAESYPPEQRERIPWEYRQAEDGSSHPCME